MATMSIRDLEGPPVLWGGVRRIQVGSEADRRREARRAREWAQMVAAGAKLRRAFAAMNRINTMPSMKYVPPWEREDRDVPWEPERDTHVMVQIGGRYYDSEGIAWTPQ
jgi:hypothetical protein